jgi:hypothetical protein
MKEKSEKCQVKYCQEQSTIIVMGRQLCDKHWAAHCKGEQNV